MSRPLNRFAKDESGATVIEYGLVGALVAVLIVSALYAMPHKANPAIESAPPSAAATSHTP